MWLSGKESACTAGAAGDSGLIPRWGRLPREENGKPLQHSCLGNSMDRGDWWATVHGVTKSQTQLSEHAHTHGYKPWSQVYGCGLEPCENLQHLLSGQERPSRRNRF